MRALMGVLVVCIAPSVAYADDAWHIVAHGLSWHDGKRTESQWVASRECETVRCERVCRPVWVRQDTSTRYNGENYGIGVRRELTHTVDAQAGIYRNSYGRTSVYTIGEWLPLRSSNGLSGGLFAGLVSGYDHGVYAGGLVARWQADRLGLTVRALPKVTEKQGASVIAIEASWRI